ncbi:hypothetical protein JMUB6875_61350 [Nocardia sp. JMUB6875]
MSEPPTRPALASTATAAARRAPARRWVPDIAALIARIHSPPGSDFTVALPRPAHGIGAAAEFY